MLRFWTTQKPGTRSFSQRYEAVAWLTCESCPPSTYIPAYNPCKQPLGFIIPPWSRA